MKIIKIQGSDAVMSIQVVYYSCSFDKCFCNLYFFRSVGNKSSLSQVLDKSYWSVFTFVAHVQFVRNMLKLLLTVPLIHEDDTTCTTWSHRSLTDRNPMMDGSIDTGVQSVCFVHMVHIGHLVMELEIRGHFIRQPLHYIDRLVQERRNSSTLALE